MNVTCVFVLNFIDFGEKISFIMKDAGLLMWRCSEPSWLIPQFVAREKLYQLVLFPVDVYAGKAMKMSLQEGQVWKSVIFTCCVLSISRLKGDLDQNNFRFGISVKKCIGFDIFRKNPRNFIFHRKIYGNQGVAYRKPENSERIRPIFELDRDISAMMLCKKIQGYEGLMSGVIE